MWKEGQALIFINSHVDVWKEVRAPIFINSHVGGLEGFGIIFGSSSDRLGISWDRLGAILGPSSEILERPIGEPKWLRTSTDYI